MALSRNVMCYSPGGEYFAYSSPDGCLKIWETSTNILKQEYTPSSHLSATCSSLAWGPCKQTVNHKKPKKSKVDSCVISVSELQLIALGTLTGDIILYSFTNSELYSSLTKGHTATVNDICWYAGDSTLFSCSSDQHIIIWDIYSGKIKTKWKADSTTVQSICVIDQNNLLSSSTSIHWWDIKNKTILKTFSGHATEVFRLLSINCNEKSSASYFLSAAIGDRTINAWQLDKNNSMRAVAAFVLSDEPENINIISEKDEPLFMSVVCKDGVLHIFEHMLNGKMKKPLQPKFTVQVASKAKESNSKPYPIPVLAADISSGLNSLLVCYGNFLRPVFERMDISEITDDLFLLRDLSSSALSVEDSVSRIRQTDKSESVKLLAPGHMTPLKPSQSSSKKRKQKESDINELPMEERLKALDLSKIPDDVDEPVIKSDSMVHLLLQGLQSKDNDMLNTVLQCGDETVIRNTLEKLPIQSILLVLKELHERLSKQEPRNRPCLRWMKGLLAVHLPYLMSCKDIDEYLGPVSQLIEARVENFSKMCQLRGCLNILLSQASINNPEEKDASTQPLIIYQSESSEESDDEVSLPSNSSEGEEIIDKNFESEESSSESCDNEDIMES